MRDDRRSGARTLADLKLNKRPDDAFMRLLAEAGDEDVVSGPSLQAAALEYTPEAIREAVFVSKPR